MLVTLYFKASYAARITREALQSRFQFEQTIAIAIDEHDGNCDVLRWISFNYAGGVPAFQVLRLERREFALNHYLGPMHDRLDRCRTEEVRVRGKFLDLGYAAIVIPEETEDRHVNANVENKSR